MDKAQRYKAVPKLEYSDSLELIERKREKVIALRRALNDAVEAFGQARALSKNFEIMWAQGNMTASEEYNKAMEEMNEALRVTFRKIEEISIAYDQAYRELCELYQKDVRENMWVLSSVFNAKDKERMN